VVVHKFCRPVRVLSTVISRPPIFRQPAEPVVLLSGIRNAVFVPNAAAHQSSFECARHWCRFVELSNSGRKSMRSHFDKIKPRLNRPATSLSLDLSSIRWSLYQLMPSYLFLLNDGNPPEVVSADFLCSPLIDCLCFQTFPKPLERFPLDTIPDRTPVILSSAFGPTTPSSLFHDVSPPTAYAAAI
jgi:hypothetical protein